MLFAVCVRHLCKGRQVGREGQAEQSIAIREGRCASKVITDHSIYDCLQVHKCVPYAYASTVHGRGEHSKAQWWVLPKKVHVRTGNITCTEMQNNLLLSERQVVVEK